MTYHITAGFMPLVDSALLVIAKAKGLAAEEGIELTLVRETSWANIRDRLAVGHMQAAHMLGPMPIAGNLGVTPLAAPSVVPMALGLGGNAVTVSNGLWQEMEGQGATANLSPISSGAALRKVVERLAREGRPRLRFAVVHPHSGHNYELRYWLAACGILPDRDLDVVILPPSFMPDALGSGAIDGFCAGEPWNTAAVMQGQGRIVAVKAAIWRQSPEKVLGLDAAWAEAHPHAVDALLRALYRASIWSTELANREEMIAVLADPGHVGCSPDWLRPALSGNLQIGPGLSVTVPDFFVPHASGATFPWKSHALWFYSQMVRWGQIAHSPAAASTARETYRPDLWRRALGPLGVALPAANAKVEGGLTAPTPVGSAGASLVLGPDGFFDEQLFDPDSLEVYIARQRDADSAQLV